MKVVNSLPAFLEEINQGSACIQLPILSIAKCLDAIDEMLKNQQHGPNDIVKIVRENLRGVCPICSIWTNGQTLSGVKLVNHIGRSKTILTGYGDKSHILDGHCINDSCSSQDIFIIWQGSQAIRQQLVQHLQRIRRDAEEKAESSKIRCLEAAAQQEVISFATDTIWAMQRHALDRHIYLKRTFSNLVMWVSVIPVWPELARSAFPRRYSAFLDEILAESGYDIGNIVVAHWICMGDAAFSMKSPEEVEWWLNLTLVSEKDAPKRDKFMILPDELC